MYYIYISPTKNYDPEYIKDSYKSVGKQQPNRKNGGKTGKDIGYNWRSQWPTDMKIYSTSLVSSELQLKITNRRQQKTFQTGKNERV